MFKHDFFSDFSKFVRKMCFIFIEIFTNIRTTHVEQILNKHCTTCLDAVAQYITYFAIFFAYFPVWKFQGTEHEGCQAFM